MENYFNKKNMQNNNYIDVELDEDEIQNLIAQGYKVEELPKAQYGKGVTSLMVNPFERGMFNTNVNAGAPDQSNFGLGIKRSNMFPQWSRENDVKTDMSAQLQIPYAMNRAPGIKGNVTTAYTPTSGSGNKVDFTTQLQGEAGYSPQYGANMNLMAFPHISGSNVPATRWRDDKYYAGAFRAGVGPQLGMSYAIKNKEVQGEDSINPGGGGLQYGARGFVEYSPTDWLKLKLEAQGMFDPVTTGVRDNVTSPSVHFSPGVNLSATMPLNQLKRKIDKLKPKDQTKIDNDRYTPKLKEGGVNNNYIDIDADDDDIANYIAQGYQVEELSKAQKGGQSDYYTVQGSDGVYKKVNNNWQVDWNKSGKFQPLSKGDVKKRTAVLNKQAKPLFDVDYNRLVDSRAYVATPKKTETKPQTVEQKKAQTTFNKDFKVTDKSNYNKIQDKIKTDQENLIKWGQENNVSVDQDRLNEVEDWGWNVYGNVNKWNDNTNQDTVKQVSDAVPQGFWDKTGDVISHPFTSAGYFMRGQDIPDYMQRDMDRGTFGYYANGDLHTERNPLDYVMDFTPTGLVNDARTVDRGIQEGNWADIGLGLASVIPGIGELRSIGRNADLGNSLNKLKRFTSFGEDVGDANRYSNSVPLEYGRQEVYNNMIEEFDKANNPGGNSLIQFGDEANPNPWYTIDPNDYKSIEEAKTIGMQDAGNSINNSINNYTENILPSKDPGFMSELNSAKFKMQSGLDSPVGPQIGPLANKWRDIDKVDLDVPSIEELQNFGLDESALAFPANVSNETILSSQQRAMIKNIEGAKQTALSKGDTELAKQFDTYISKIKNDELKKFTETPYTGEQAMSNTTLNYSGNEVPDTNNLFDETDKDLALHFLKEKNKEDIMGHSTTEMHFNDWKNQKLLDLETPEGQRRIEKFLNDNPSKVNVNDFMDKFENLEYYNITKPMQKNILNNVDKVNDVTDKITKLSKDRDQYYDVINEDNYTLYNKEIERLDAEITMLENDKDGLISDTEDIIKLIDQKNKNAFYESGNNSIFIGEEYQTPQELPRLIGHEGSHPLTARLLGQTSFNSKMDQDLIKELKLTKKIPKHLEKKLSAEEIRNTPSGVSQKGAIDKARDTKKYWEEAKNYWESGKFKKGQSNEPTSFIAEVRTAMKEDGIIKNDYDPITEDMLKAYYEDYIKKPLHHSSLRVFDIMENDASNFKVLKKHINDLLSLAPYLIPAGVGVGAAAASGEDNTPQYKYGGNVNKLQKFIK